MNGNATVLAALFAELDALGVREFCICAGARNAAIIDALARSGPEIVLRHFFDERSAAFFALGRTMQRRLPVAVLTTSGTAVAELMPAMVEASHQNVPLIAITADRPSRYVGSGAPQAIEQKGIFGCHVSREVDIASSGDQSLQLTDHVRSTEGPVHFNVRLEEGLETFQVSNFKSQMVHAPALAATAQLSTSEETVWNEFWNEDGELVVLAAGLHPADVPAVREFLLKLNAPVVAETTANLHGEDSLKHLLLRGGERILRSLDRKRVLRIGSVPSWRWWRDLESLKDVRVLNISRAPFRGLARTANVATVSWAALRNLEGGWRIADGKRNEDNGLLDRALDAHPCSEPAWMRHLSRVIGGDAVVFLGNSLPVREWNLAADPPKTGVSFFANRGVNGIDGLLSTALGVTAEAVDGWIIVGDLSALYDLGAPWVLAQLPAAKRRIVVINNGGGKIFSRVPWLDGMSPQGKRMMENAHQTKFEPWARMWSMDYRCFTNPEQLRDDDSPSAVWEIVPDEAETSAFWDEWAGC